MPSWSNHRNALTQKLKKVAKMQIIRGDGSSSLPLGDEPGDRGRRAVAQTDVQVGELVLRSKAFAAVLLPELWSAHCHKCFISGGPLSRCGRCHTAYYCSRECQQQDWKPDHRKECKHLAELVTLGLRSDQVSDVLLLGRVIRRSNQSVAAESEPDPSPWELVWFEEDLVDQELLLLATLAQKLQLVDETQSIEELQRMLSRFRANNFSICDELLLELGAGCFPLGAMVNHSCAPTCAVTFVPKTLEMEFRAMATIKSGQEITQTYVDIALPRRERQQRLQHKYHFDCSCCRCSRPLEDPESLDAFLDADIDGISQEKWPIERQEALERALQEVSEATGRAASAPNPVDQQQQHVEALKQLMKRQSKLLHPENIELLKTCSALFSAEMERGGVAEAVGHGERMLQFYRHVYSRNHPMTGLHLFTLGDLQAQLAQATAEDAANQEKATGYLTEARRILRITHGKSHRFVEMLTQRLQDGAKP